MKKVIFGLLLSSFGTVFSALASDATLKSEVTFVHASCNLTDESKTMTVPLGNVSRKDVVYAQSTSYFSLKATGCPPDGSARIGIRFDGSGLNSKEVAIKWSAAPDMTPQTVLYRRPVAQFSNFQPKIVSSWLILALFQANFLISGRSRLCPYQLVNSNQVRQGE
ncbi:fimbrial protein [Serratia marcescens]